MSRSNVSEADIRAWCIAYLERTLDSASIPVDPQASFSEIGLDSVNSAHFIVDLEEWLGIELEPELVFEYPTISQLARHIASQRDPG